MSKWVKPPLRHRSLKGLRGYQGLSQPYFNEGAEEARFTQELRAAGRRKKAELPERQSKAQNLYADRVEFGIGALYHLQLLSSGVAINRRNEEAKNPPVIHYTDGTTSLDRTKN